MKGGAGQQEHAGLPMDMKGRLDPSHPAAQLEEDQGQVDDTQDQDQRSDNFHGMISYTPQKSRGRCRVVILSL
jgi:hypothetical protein